MSVRNSGIGISSSDSGIGRNSVEFRGIPSNSWSERFPEFRDGIASKYSAIVRIGTARMSDSGIGRNRTEFRGIPSNSVQFRNRSHISNVRVRIKINVSAEFRNRNQFERFRNRAEWYGIVGMDSGIAGNW